MKKYLFILLLAAVSVTMMAQNQGGEIRRPVRTNSNQGNNQRSTATSTQRTNRSNVASSAANNNESDRNDAPQSATHSMSPILLNLVNNMVHVDGGTFMMGATAEQGSGANSDEKPVHQVTLSSFSIGKYEVTQEEWKAVMGSNPSYFKGEKRPVEQVSWNNCQEFIDKLNKLTGMSFRLPTEAEWEFAARGGTHSRGYKYAGGTNIGNVAWSLENSGYTTHEVGRKAANELGLYDMSGNVREWCADWYGSYGSSVQSNPKGTSSNSFRVRRGGSWNNSAWVCRVSSRGYGMPSDQNRLIGFRLAL